MSIYGLLRELRDTIFVTFIGLQYIVYVKYLSLVAIFFSVFLYEYMLKKKGRWQTFFLINMLYGLMILLFLLFFVFKNHRVFGYFFTFFSLLFYLILEGFPPFVWGLLWALTNSVSSAQDIKNKYLYFTASGQLGGFLFTGLFALLIKYFFFANEIAFYLLFLTISVLFFVAAALANVMKKKHIPSNEDKILVGEHFVNKNQQHIRFGTGLKLIGQDVYLIGIFFIIVFWEIINVSLNYFRLDFFSKDSAQTSGVLLLGNLYYATAMAYALGFFIVFFGTSFLVRMWGVKKTLLVIPFLLIVVSLLFFVSGQKSVLLFFYIFMRAFYPALLYPVKESLFIKTSYAIQFEAKSWIDSFGSRLGKAIAATYISLCSFSFFHTYVYFFHCLFFGAIIIFWFLISLLVGKRYEENNL